MNPTLESLFRRRSIRKYTEQPVEPEKLDLLLQAAMAAPSAMNCKPWEFVLVTDPEKLAQFRKRLIFGNRNAPAAIVVCGNPSLSANPAARLFWEQDCIVQIYPVGTMSPIFPNLHHLRHLRMISETRVGSSPFTSKEWARLDSNQRPSDYESPALTAELRAHFQENDEQLSVTSCALMTDNCSLNCSLKRSGRRDSNPRISAWKADALPLGDARVGLIFYRQDGRQSSNHFRNPKTFIARFSNCGYNSALPDGAWRSPASALAWGARGPGFNSRRPD